MLRLRDREERPIPDRPRIGFIRLDGVGDVVDALEAARAIKARFPEGSLCLVVRKELADFVSKLEFVDEVIPVDLDLYAPTRGLFYSIRSVFRLRRLLLNGRFDIAIEPRGDPRIVLAMLASKIPHRIGVRSAGAGRLLTAATDYTRTILESRHNLSVAGLLGAAPLEDAFQLQTEPDVWQFLVRDYPMLMRPFFLVHSSGTMQSRIWPVERFTAVVEAISASYNLLPVIDGGADAVADAAKIEASSRAEILNLAGKTDLIQFAALSEHARLFVGNNSGPAHIAALSGCPCVVVFGGANDPLVWKPPGEHVVAVANMLECSPCDLRYCPDPRCMLGISVDDVLEAVRRLIG